MKFASVLIEEPREYINMDTGIASLRVGDVECPTVSDSYFSTVRSAFSIDDGFLDGNFDFSALGQGGGKGGDLMSRTTCGRFFVKELNGGDGKSLLDPKFLQAYCDLIVSKTSLLCKVVAVFKHPQLGQFLVMANCLPTFISQWSGLYDLKGSADDKALVEDGERVPEIHKRCWNVTWMLCEATGCGKGIPADRTRYVTAKKRAYQLPLYLTKEQRAEVMTQINRDVALFTEFNLMDYSMIVGVYRPPPGEADAILQKSQNLNHLHGKAYASTHGGDTTIVYLGIIDFLQAWTGGKRCAHLIKAVCAPPPISTIDPKRYAKQFVEFFGWKLRGVGHALPPAFAETDASGTVVGIDSKKIVEEVRELRATVSEMSVKLDLAERKVKELEEEKHDADFHDAD